MKAIKISLDDLGQVSLVFYVDENGIVLDVQPPHTTIWRGTYVRMWDESLTLEGKSPIHNPLCFGNLYLKCKIESIEEVEAIPANQ